MSECKHNPVKDVSKSTEIYFRLKLWMKAVIIKKHRGELGNIPFGSLRSVRGLLSILLMTFYFRQYWRTLLAIWIN